MSIAQQNRIDALERQVANLSERLEALESKSPRVEQAAADPLPVSVTFTKAKEAGRGKAV